MHSTDPTSSESAVSHERAGDINEILAALDRDGYAIVPDAIDPSEVAKVRSSILELMGPTGRNSFEGFDTQRVYGVMARTSSCDHLVEHPLVLAVMDRLLEQEYTLSQVVAINIQPGEEAQALHHDDALYAVPRPRGPISVGVMWAIDDFTATNGATRVIPASHRWSDEVTNDLAAADLVQAEMRAGSLMIFLGTVWHGGGANQAQAPRCGLTTQYCQPWARTVENFSLSMPRDRVAACSPRMQGLLGYSIHANLMGYVDGRHPRRLLTNS